MVRMEQISDTDYFAHPALDQTMLKKFMQSPRAYAWAKEHPVEDNAAFAFGKAMHSIVLGSGPAPMERPDARTKAGKEALALYADDENVVMLSARDMELVDMMKRNMPDIAGMHPGRPEVAMFATDPDSGVELKGKADWLPNGPDEDGVYRIVDYKTLRDQPEDFPHDAYKYGYHIQAAFYMRLYRLCTGYAGPLGFEFITQSKQAPYDWMVWRFTETQMEIRDVANPRIDQALQQFAWWQQHPDANMLDWGADHTPQPIEYTNWQITKEMEEL
ncbi:PD-(D/E)XK nuclease-like domain-containing protein [Bifidobacterium cuniculi]|uniref:Phage protein n=1 Tax=Bifidobacterium cuniculi TaxID=1688 RepID=A0A087B4Z0_9BIFI|nr:PD-(D/E)XK nuclease-like domain-containing protein [Bifidobacterium cuniculi]KFI66090.1 phage protein [Bifidobacterium cuniculi]